MFTHRRLLWPVLILVILLSVTAKGVGVQLGVGGTIAKQGKKIFDQDKKGVWVHVLSPSEGALVSGVAPIIIEVGPEVARVGYSPDEFPETVVTGLPFGWVWDTRPMKDGQRHLVVRAYGENGSAAEVSLTVLVDNTAPRLRLDSPDTVLVTTGPQCLTAMAEDENGVARVVFLLDGAVQKSVTRAPYSWDWNPSPANNGQRTATIEAFDRAGNRKRALIAMHVAIDPQSTDVALTAPETIHSFSAPLQTSGLVGHWEFDENRGTVAKDSSGNQHDSTLVNGASWTTGKTGSAVRFSPLSNNAVTFPSGLQNTGFPKSGALAFWLNVDLFGHQNGVIFDSISARNHLCVRTYGEGYLQIVLQDATGNYLNQKGQMVEPPNSTSGVTKIPLSVNTWTHLAVVWDSNNGMAYFYKDGARVVSFYWGAYDPSWTPSAQVFKFGSSGGTFSGVIDDVVLYSRPLSPKDIAAIYNGTAISIADTIAPSAPSLLAGNGFSPSKTVLGWSASTDVVGVGGYVIYRDGRPAGYTSPASLSFVDSGLLSSSRYSYQVVAFDTSGNRSTASNSVNVRTNQELLLLNTNFEEATPVNTADIGGWVKYGPNSDAVVVTREKARAGLQSVKFIFNKEDWRAGVSSTNYYQRAQISQRAPILMTLGNTYWTGISTYIPEDWQNDLAGNAELIWQFHSSTDGASEGGSPPLMLHIGGSTAAIKVLGDTYDKVYTPTSTVSKERAPIPVIIYSSPLNADKGRWIDWVIETNFNYSSGFVRVWKNGVKIADYTGPTIYRTVGQKNENGPWFNFGPYKWGWGDSPSLVTNRTMFVDDVRQAFNPSCHSPACSGVTDPDTIAPTVSLVSPAPRAILSGAQTISATATDNVGVEGVQFKIDNTFLGEEDTTFPYTIPWDTHLYPNGSHVISAVARDAMGYRTMSERGVTVLNALTTTPLSSGWLSARGSLEQTMAQWEFKESIVTGSHYVYLRSTSGISTSDWLRFSVWVKRGEGGPPRDILIYFYNSDAPANRGTANCTLSGSGNSSSSAGGMATDVSSAITAEGDGWYECSIVARLDTLRGTKITLNILAANGGSLSYPGDSTSGFLFKNPKVEKF